MFALVVCVSTLCVVVNALDPEVNLDTLGIIKHWNYPAESHTVITDDGYILTLQRIPYGLGPQNHTNRPIMFMQHGLEGQSSNWVTNLPWQSAAFIFADQGFDVWLGNFRGNLFGRNHTTISPKNITFWKFSWDEMAFHDLPSMFNYVLKTTGQKTLNYMGHSQGTMTAFALFSVNKTAAAQVSKFFALGPVATIGDIKQGLLKALAPYVNVLSWWLQYVGMGEFLPDNFITKWLADLVCGFSWTNPMCANVMFLIGGPNSKQMNLTRESVFVHHNPAGTSTQNIQHFGQQVNSKQFQAFDYGNALDNQHHYNQPTPPLYYAKNVTVPVYLYWGALDTLADPDDVQYLVKNLGNLAGNCELAQFTHLDFIWGLRAAEDVYQSVINVIRGEPFECVG